jgi:DNA modification methylase
MKKLTWTTIRVPLGTLKEWDKNPATISEKDAKQLARSLDKFGHIIPFVAAAPKNGKKELPLLDGHQRKAVLLSLQKTDPKSMVDVRVPNRPLTEKEKQEAVVRLRFNTGEPNPDAFLNWYEGTDLLDWGVPQKEAESWGFEFEDTTKDAEPQIDRAAELLKKWKVKTGDLWQIGEHRLICGDCTDAAVVARVMDVPAEMTFIDPPYNALKSWNKDEAHGETRLDPSKWFENDNMEWDEYWKFIEQLFKSLQGHSVYVCCDYRIYAGIREKVEQAGYAIKHCIVWKKNVWGLGKRYRFQHEFIVYACKGDAPFYGGRDQSDVWELDIHKTTEHNTPKPSELPARAIANSSADGAVVFDGCCGSGTTLVACENLHRRCRAVEISPAYVAVALERMATAFPGIHIERVK